MKLRNFLYLNTRIVNDYISAIDGYIYDEESQALANSTTNTIGGKGGISVLSGSGEHSEQKTEEVTRSVKINDVAKFDKIYCYLQKKSDEGLKYFEFLSDETYDNLQRDDFIEVLVTVRFSKMKEITDTVKKLGDLALTIQGLTEQQIFDKSARDVINGFSALDQLRSGKEIACVFNFEDEKYPLISYLDESYFRCEQENFIGQAYILCKVLRKIPKGQNVKLDEVFDIVKKMPLNREQRRNMPKNMDNPDVIKDVVKGPALVVIPIAVYQ